MLVSPRIAGLREHNGEVVGEAMWPAIIDRANHDRLVGLLGDPSRRRDNFGRPACTRWSVWSLRVVRRQDDDRDRSEAGSRVLLPKG